jgi:poly(3-hydroxybutyrate) depolymerase
MKRFACTLLLSLCVGNPVWAIDPPLASYAIDIHQTSVSGVSSGAAMAVQVHVAHSSIMRGVGIIAGVAYDCADPNLPSVAQRLGIGATCMDGFFDYAGASIARTDAAAAIDATSNLRGQKVWLFSGYNDGLVRRGAMDSVAKYYDHYVNSENVFYKTNNHAPHAFISNYGAACLASNAQWLNNCNYDAAGFLLRHIYGYLKPPKSTLSSSPQAFDQHDFVNGDPKAVGLADTGYVYVPTECQTQTCRVHIVFHGCKQYAQKVGDAVYGRGGYNRWADANKIIVLYPQAAPVGTEPLGNLDGCWNWWGFLGDSEHDFAQKTGQQISAIKKMVDRLTAGPPRSGGPSDIFGPPQNFRVSDSTPTSLALTWQTNSAAIGFNIYRSRTKSGSYTKINSALAPGPSFVDRELAPRTTYYYKISAVDGANGESATTGPVRKKTASNPRVCSPYFSNNLVHVQTARAFAGLNSSGQVVARALGSGEILGPIDENHFSQLIKDGPLPVYHVRYCP